MNVLPFFMGARAAPNIADLFSITLDTAANLDGVSTTGWDLLVGKSRVNATDWVWRDGAQGISDYIESNTTNAAAAFSDYATLLSAGNAVLYRFKKSPGFCDVVTFTHTNGVTSNVATALTVPLGLATVKRLDSTSDWYTNHRSLTAGNNLRLNTTAAESATAAYVSFSGSTVVFASAAPSGDYVVYVWGHDTSASGIVQCGSYTEPSGGNFVDINLGWPPQFLLAKASSALTDWVMVDTARGMEIGTATKWLSPNLSNAEASGFANGFFTPISTGFTAGNTFVGGGGATVIYMAIRAES